MKTKEKGMVAVKRMSIFERAFNFFRGMFYKSNIERANTDNSNDIINKACESFSEFALYRIDRDEMLKLIAIQNEIERRGISEKTIAELTCNLTVDEKRNLEDLYKIQIRERESILERIRCKIVKIKNEF